MEEVYQISSLYSRELLQAVAGEHVKCVMPKFALFEHTVLAGNKDQSSVVYDFYLGVLQKRKKEEKGTNCQEQIIKKQI